jgi:aspartyl-tRNA synthetase
MLLSNVGRYSPRLRTSYIEISNYLRSRPSGLRNGLRTLSPVRTFHRGHCLLEQHDSPTSPRHFLEQYKKAGMNNPSCRILPQFSFCTELNAKFCLI